MRGRGIATLTQYYSTVVRSSTCLEEPPISYIPLILPPKKDDTLHQQSFFDHSTLYHIVLREQGRPVSAKLIVVETFSTWSKFIGDRHGKHSLMMLGLLKKQARSLLLS